MLQLWVRSGLLFAAPLEGGFEGCLCSKLSKSEFLSLHIQVVALELDAAIVAHPHLLNDQVAARIELFEPVLALLVNGSHALFESLLALLGHLLVLGLNSSLLLESLFAALHVFWLISGRGLGDDDFVSHLNRSFLELENFDFLGLEGFPQALEHLYVVVIRAGNWLLDLFHVCIEHEMSALRFFDWLFLLHFWKNILL